MKLEASSASEKSESQKSNEEEIELSDEEVVLNLLKANSPIDLNELKSQTGLSNKKWDKAIKGLTKNNLAKVEKKEEELWVSVLSLDFSCLSTWNKCRMGSSILLFWY